MIRQMDRRAIILAALGSVVVPATSTAQAISDPNNQEPTDMRVRFAFGSFTMAATLYNNASARDFYSMLPLNLTISDYGSNEKIAYLPRKLTEEGNGPFANEQPYDLCYYVPWGNLAMFHGGYRHNGLIRLGRFEEGSEALHEAGEYPLRVEVI